WSSGGFGIEEPVRLRQARDPLHVARGLASCAEARCESRPRISGRCLVLCESRRGRADEQAAQTDVERHELFHFTNSRSNATIRSISIRWSASTSDAKA